MQYDVRCINGATSAERDAALLLVPPPNLPLFLLHRVPSVCSLKDSAVLQADGNGTLCNVSVVVASHMRAPVFVYYELENYYQNHRRYAMPSSSSSWKPCGLFTRRD